jgi:site-specific recombinase XerD
VAVGGDSSRPEPVGIIYRLLTEGLLASYAGLVLSTTGMSPASRGAVRMVSNPYWAKVRGPLAAYVDGFRDELQRLGYTPLSAAAHVRLMAHLSRWLVREGLSISALTASTVEAYFAERRAAGYVNERTPRALAPLVTYLRRLGVVPPEPPRVPTGPVEVLLSQYQDYLLVERGLAASTAALNVRLARPFLATQVGADGQLDLSGLRAGDVTAFVVAQSRQQPRSAKRIVTAVRSLLRFAHVAGLIDRPLAAGVPSPAGWTLTSLPKGLDPAQVTALLAVATSADGVVGTRSVREGKGRPPANGRQTGLSDYGQRATDAALHDSVGGLATLTDLAHSGYYRPKNGTRFWVTTSRASSRVTPPNSSVATTRRCSRRRCAAVFQPRWSLRWCTKANCR